MDSHIILDEKVHTSQSMYLSRNIFLTIIRQHQSVDLLVVRIPSRLCIYVVKPTYMPLTYHQMPTLHVMHFVLVYEYVSVSVVVKTHHELL